jgi:uncharacterized protein (TIGR02231 family)
MMKKLALLIGSIFLCSGTFATENEIKIPSKIKEVTVFQKGAQIYKTGSVFVEQGVTDLLITDLPRNINQQSIQVKGFGNFTILSVNYQLNYLKSQKDSKQIKNLKDSLEMLKFTKKDTENKIETYKAEETILLANKSIGGDQSGVSITALKEAMNYFHVKLNEIKSKELELNGSLSKINESITRIQNQLNSLQSKLNNPTSEVLVKVLAKERTKAVLDLRYVIYNAGWTPEYDLRAIDITKPVQLNYKAKVYQSSGEDWENVKLKISTGNPQVSGVKPEIYPWYVSFYEPPQYMIRGNAPQAKAAAVYNEMEIVEFDEEEEAVAEVSYFEATTNQTNVEFNIDIPYSIPSDGKAYTVQINEFSLDAHYTYYTAPKLKESAFLLAQITGWEQYNLLAGSANIFFEGTYVGNSTIDPQTANDTLNLSLGRDEAIVVSRTKIKDFESQRLIGLNKKETFGYKIEVRNNKSATISIIVDDQFPISTNKDIEIEQIEKSGAKFNDTTGKINWEFELNPMETKKLEMKYSIKYPKDKKIEL